MRRSLIALILTSLLVLSACQSPEHQAKERLQEQVASVREAAEQRDVVAAAQRLTILRADVARMRQEDLITEQETQRILTAALQVQANLAWIAPAAVPPPPAPDPAPVPAPQQLEPPGSNAGGSINGSAGQRGQKGEKGQKGENGKGNDDDDD